MHIRKTILIHVIIFFILIPLKSFSQDYSKPVLKSVILQYFSPIDSLGSKTETLKHFNFKNAAKNEKTKTKWYVRLGRGCLFGAAGLYLGWKITDETNIMSTRDEGEDAMIFTLCVAGAGFLIGLLI